MSHEQSAWQIIAIRDEQRAAFACSSGPRHIHEVAPLAVNMAAHTADERFTPVKRGVATLDIWVMVAFAVITIWVLFFI